MPDFKTYEEARAYAQEQANADGVSRGIAKITSIPGYGPWTVKMLPAKQYRYGWETTCEAVDPETTGLNRRLVQSRDSDVLCDFCLWHSPASTTKVYEDGTTVCANCRPTKS